ncbi:MAG TPA: TonB-dependent receptor [Candidatus Acidoferrum sp.]|nr:TonB-dependent receptor [Candidatus Acidoferrum sp.]
MKTTFLRTAFLFLLVLAVSFSSQAQNNSNSADAHLFGTLLDSSSAAIGSVNVTAHLEGNATAQLWKTTTSADGAYSLTIPPGRYHMSFDRSPFVARDLVLDLAPSEQRRLNISLDLERLSSSVIVTAQAEPILADQTTAPVSVIAKEEIDDRQSVALTDALQFSTGVAIGRTGPEGGSASVFLNGGNSDFTKVLVDGTPINPPGSAVDFSNLTLDNIDKVEIVRGAESAIYGTDAVDGVIQLFTHRGSTRTPEFSAFSEGGSFSSGRGGAQLGGLLGKFDYSAAASYMETDGQGPNDGFINRTLSGNFGYTFSDDNQLRLTIRNNTSDAGIPGQTVFTPPSLYQRYGQEIFSAGARWDFSTGKHWRHEISGGESYTRQFSDNPLQSFYATDPNAFCPQTNPTAVATAEFCDYVGESLYKYNRANVSAQTSYLLSNFGVTAGYQYEVENASLSSIDVPHARRNNQGGFLDFRYRPQRRISLNFGGRAEANAYFGTRVVPRAGGSLVVRYGSGFWGETLFRIFYGQGIKEPRFDQIFGDNFGDFGNPALKPESSKTTTAGIEQKLLGDRVRISADYFYSYFYNIVSFEFCVPDATNPAGNSCGVTLPGNPTSFGYYFNTDLALARGLNLAGVTRFTRWLNLAGNYTYDDSRVIQSPNSSDPSEIAGNHLLRRPVNSGSLTLNAAYRRFGMTIGGYFTGVRTDSDFLGLGLTSNPGYALFNIATHYDVGYGVSFYARATNLFNKQYQDALGYPALGRDVRAGVRYTFSGRN